METSKKVSSFIKQFIAVVQGDTAEATAQKVLRQADSALSTQLNNLKGDLVDKEGALQDAKDNLALARLNDGKDLPGSERPRYVERLFKAKNAVTLAEEDLEKHKAKIEFIESELKSLKEEV